MCTLCCYVGTYFYLGCFTVYLDKLLKLFVWGLLGYFEGDKVLHTGCACDVDNA